MAQPYKKQQIESFNYDEDQEEIKEISPIHQPIESQNVLIEKNMQVEQTDLESLFDSYKLLIEYKNNLFKVDLLLHSEEDETTIQELTAIKEQLLPAIAAQEQQIKELQQNQEFKYSTERLKSEDIGKICKAFYEKDKKWYNARITSIDVDNQMAETQFIGYQDCVQLHAIFIKISSPPDALLFDVGTQCEAIYPGDGRYYPCTIEKIAEDGQYLVKFKKYNNKELISIYYLREPKKIVAEQKNQKNIFEDLNEFKVPDNLKILPSDNEQIRQAKKKKLKAMKQQYKMAQQEQYAQTQQTTWKSFQTSIQGMKPDIGQKQKTLYRAPDKPTQNLDDGVSKSILTQQAKLKLRDNPQKRLF